jgi:hypothetical protein
VAHVATSATRGPDTVRHRRPSPAGSRPGGDVAHAAHVVTPCQLAPTTRSSPAAVTRSKLGDVGGNGQPLLDRGQAAASWLVAMVVVRHRPVPASRRRDGASIATGELESRVGGDGGFTCRIAAGPLRPVSASRRRGR